jgi:hypothetical protein
MLAPTEFKKLATSTICGSFAQFSIVVVPGTRVAAKIALIVPPTVTTSKKIEAASNFLEVA